MPKKKIEVIRKEDVKKGHISANRIDFGPLKRKQKNKWRRRKTKTGKPSPFVEKSEVFEDNEGRKYVRNSMRNAEKDGGTGSGGSYDWQTAKNHRRGVFGQAGKGDAPRSIGKNFHKNYKEIDWGTKKEKTRQGLPVPRKFKKVYK